MQFIKRKSSTTSRANSVNLGTCRKSPILVGETPHFPQTITSVNTLAGSTTQKKVTVKLATPVDSGIRSIKTSYHNIVKAIAPDGSIVEGKVTGIVAIKNLDNVVTNYELTAKLILDQTKTGTYHLLWQFLAVVDSITAIVEVPQTYDFTV